MRETGGVRVVLASASPSRLRLLTAAGVDPVVRVSSVDEDAVIAQAGVVDPFDVAAVLAAAKAREVAATAAVDDIVIGCDSVLAVDGRPLGKPLTADVARHRWHTLRGRSGDLITGHCLILGDREQQGLARTRVHFADLDDDEIDAYVGTGEPLHVAGGFTLDGVGSAYVTGIDGDPANVIGLSVPLVRELVRDLGITWHSLWSPDRAVGVDRPSV